MRSRRRTRTSVKRLSNDSIVPSKLLPLVFRFELPSCCRKSFNSIHSQNKLLKGEPSIWHSTKRNIMKKNEHSLDIKNECFMYTWLEYLPFHSYKFALETFWRANGKYEITNSNDDRYVLFFLNHAQEWNINNYSFLCIRAIAINRNYNKLTILWILS